jgi:uncharacterized RDD family membrane protein YckC
MTEGGVSPIPREARAFQGAPAGVVSRLVAATVDAVVVVLLLLALYLGYAAARFFVDPLGFAFPRAALLLSLSTALPLLVVYLAAAWAFTGRTYGCQVMGLRVVSARGCRLRPLTACIRACLCVVVPVGLLWCAVSRQRRSLQDVVLRTAVVYDWQSSGPRESR